MFAASVFLRNFTSETHISKTEFCRETLQGSVVLQASAVVWSFIEFSQLATVLLLFKSLFSL